MKLEYIGLEHMHNTLRCSFLGTRTRTRIHPAHHAGMHAGKSLPLHVDSSTQASNDTSYLRERSPPFATFPWFVPSATVATMAAVTLSPEGLQADRAQAAWEWWHRIHSGAHSPLTWLAPMVGQVARCPCLPCVHIHAGLIKAWWACCTTRWESEAFTFGAWGVVNHSVGPLSVVGGYACAYV